MDAQWAEIPPTGGAHLFVVSGVDLEEIVYKMAKIRDSFQDKKSVLFRAIAFPVSLLMCVNSDS
jgi:hypothetical protein